MASSFNLLCRVSICRAVWCRAGLAGWAADFLRPIFSLRFLPPCRPPGLNFSRCYEGIREEIINLKRSCESDQLLCEGKRQCCESAKGGRRTDGRNELGKQIGSTLPTVAEWNETRVMQSYDESGRSHATFFEDEGGQSPSSGDCNYSRDVSLAWAMGMVMINSTIFIL